MDVYAEWAELRARDGQGALVILTRVEGIAPAPSGSKMIVSTDGSVVGTVGGGPIEARLVASARAVLREPSPRLVSLDLAEVFPGEGRTGRVEAFIEPTWPRDVLILFGAGHVARALAALAPSLGFRVIVVDERVTLATRERFPDAEAVICRSPLEAIDSLPFAPRTFVAILTHEHSLDEALLRRCLGRELTYLGMMGSRQKIERLRPAFLADGVDPTRLSRVRSPIGVSIGSRTPAEIAVSIAAELVQARHEGGPPCPPHPCAPDG